MGGYRGDLFPGTTARGGGGAVDAQPARLCEIAAERGRNTVRRITADDSYRACSKDDQAATGTMSVTYDTAPQP
ncbi:hypothetical protein [Kitasatospora sp. P5_F3]